LVTLSHASALASLSFPRPLGLQDGQDGETDGHDCTANMSTKIGLDYEVRCR